MKRKTGYYWVRYASKTLWEIAFWNGAIPRWEFRNNFHHMQDHHFAKINEDRILNPDEK